MEKRRWGPLLPPELCKELLLQHVACAVPGYRPGCSASTLLCAPRWAWPALLRARDILRDAAEDLFGDFLWPETTVTVAWFPGSGLPLHADNGRSYLAQRHVSAVCWLGAQGEDFQGGDFFFAEGPTLRPQAGHGVIFSSEELHGLKEVTQGMRVALNVWFTRDPAAAEDPRLLRRISQCRSGGARRVFGEGPQASWPPGEPARVLARQTAQAVAKAPRRFGQAKAVCKSLGRGTDGCGGDWRFDVALRACRLYMRSGRLLRILRAREQQVTAALPSWRARGLLSAPCDKPRLRRPRRPRFFGRVDTAASVPGLTVLRGALKPNAQARLLRRAERLLCGACNQAMRFGDLPHWAQRLAKRCRIPGFRVRFDQLIVNAYNRGEGIRPHVDLLKFGEQVAGVSLGSEATLKLRRIRAERLPVKPGEECRLSEEDLEVSVSVALAPGDVYGLAGPARYNWTHEICPESVLKRRVSLTFRRLVSALGPDPIDTAAVGSVLSSLPIMVQYTAGHQWLPASRVSKAFRWLARTLGPAALGLLAGVAVLSLLQLLCKAAGSGARDSLSFKDGYLRVATEEL
ncbi:unnamed protein product [Effrenium voratum]|nr:unnamed protein product [Effrenium voratum]